MAHLTADEIALHRFIAEQSFEDTCNILVWSGYSDSYSDELDSWPTTLSGIPCGFRYNKAALMERGQAVIIEDDATLRLSLEQDISVKDKVEVRNKTWHVDGITDGVTVKVVILKQMETNE